MDVFKNKVKRVRIGEKQKYDLFSKFKSYLLCSFSFFPHILNRVCPQLFTKTQDFTSLPPKNELLNTPLDWEKGWDKITERDCYLSELAMRGTQVWRTQGSPSARGPQDRSRLLFSTKDIDYVEKKSFVDFSFKNFENL